MQCVGSLICHHILNCGIFGRFWRGRVQITADPEYACGELVEVDIRSVGVSVLHRVPPIVRVCAQFVVGRATSSGPSVNRPPTYAVFRSVLSKVSGRRQGVRTDRFMATVEQNP